MNNKYITPNISLYSGWLSFKLNNDQLSDNVWFEYNCQNANTGYFRHIVNQLIQRHEILRYSFLLPDHELKICVINSQDVPVNINLINYFGQKNWKERTLQKVQQAFYDSFHLEKSPLFRTFLVRIDQSKYKFIFIIPHLLVDAHTLNMFYHETDELYQKLTRGDTCADLSAGDIQFGSYIKEQNESNRNPNHGSNSFWLSHFKGGISNIFLGDKVKCEDIIQSKKEYNDTLMQFLKQNKIELNFSKVFLLHHHKYYHYRTFLQIVRKNILEKLENLAKLSESTVFSIITSCYYIALYSVSRKPHVAICYTMSTRNNALWQKAGGYFLNLLIVKQTVNENISVIDFIKDTHRHINQMKTHCISSMPKIWQDSGLSDYINIPLNINYFINQHPVISDTISKQEGTHNRQNGGFMFDIDIKAIQGADGIMLFYNYKEELFSKEYIEEFTGKMESMVNQITEAPYMPVNYFTGRVYDVI